jgi:O-acetyl-ADP-ribose deacetylase (regulator of RNase III)
MITNIDKCLVQWFKEQTNNAAIIEQLNCWIIQGGGIAARIRQEYPQIYAADVKFGRKGDITKLGEFCVANVYPDKLIYGYYGQYDLGTNKRQTNYEAVYVGLTEIKKHAIENGINIIGLPKNMGSTLGGARFSIIERMIEIVFENSGIDVYICNYDPSKK